MSTKVYSLIAESIWKVLHCRVLGLEMGACRVSYTHGL